MAGWVETNDTRRRQTAVGTPDAVDRESWVVSWSLQSPVTAFLVRSD